MIISEDDLEKYSTCVLINKIKKETADDIFATSVKTMEWVLIQMADSSIPELGSIRTKFIYNWKKLRKQEDDPFYWDGPIKAAGQAVKLYKLALKYKCTIPLTKYTYTIGNNTVEGSVALLADNKKYPKSYVLNHIDVVYQRPIFTEHKALARWLYIKEEYDIAELGILHFPLIYGTSWKDRFINEPLAKEWLGSILETAGNIRYPRAGNYCARCTAPCKELYGSNVSIE
jgi:hypothetical protein